MDATFYAGYESWLDTLEIQYCRDCGHEMHVYQQERINKPPLVLAECKNRGCSLHDVTLDADTWRTITEARLNEYRAIVNKMRAGAA